MHSSRSTSKRWINWGQPKQNTLQAELERLKAIEKDKTRPWAPPVHPSKFSACVSSMCRAEKDWNTRLERLTVNEAVKRNLKAAFQRAPTGKAVGSDGVSVEMLVANADIRFEFILATWEACGRVKGLPRAWRQATLIPIYKKENHILRLTTALYRC